ncbi:Oidioi.mRNA.OKI2018_I69.chr2.g4598.t1.cds [Oikopleura dioica]|uniref:Oidioi.mRNA.OKI2018_I69.chr2.g4598.t1.cds n=1 Tax=Oikopleura dioica TaxID=34765 RepID=A0ABN7T1N5_OIKDI|nr:Oidioi.mRNA.OKI2018_I69.chr2.g4598.t1.cds [Oikopleura dioica]
MKLFSAFVLAAKAQVEVNPDAFAAFEGPGALAASFQAYENDYENAVYGYYADYDTDYGEKARPPAKWFNKPTKRPIKKVTPKPRPTRPSQNQQKQTQRPSRPNQRPTQRPTQRPKNRPTQRPKTEAPRKTQRPTKKPVTQKPRPNAQKQQQQNNNKNTGNKNTYEGLYAPNEEVNYTNNNGNVYSQPDVNECYKGTDNCHYNARCVNTVGSFQCICKNGYQGNGVNCTPKDVNECANGSHNCDTYAQCVNTVGSYACTCNNGYNGNGYTCKPNEVNECATGQHNCHVNAYCTDLPNNYGQYKCTCNNGYQDDVDECALGTHNCASNASCTNTQTGFNCTCPSGWTGDGITCYAPMQTCGDYNPCVGGATCQDTSNGPQCMCGKGLKGNGRMAPGDGDRAKPDWASTYDASTGTISTGNAPAGSATYPSSSYPASSGSSGSNYPSSSSGSSYSNSGSSGSSTYPSSSGTYTGSSGNNYQAATYSDAGNGCGDIDECAPCNSANSYAGGCPCSEPMPVCTNTVGSYYCSSMAGYGDPHFRVTSPGETPVCLDVNAVSGSIIDLISDASSNLELNGLFKNVQKGKKQFLTAIGYTSPQGTQMALTRDTLEVYENGKLLIKYNPSEDTVDEYFYDVHLKMKPADHEHHRNRHNVEIVQQDGFRFRLTVKPGVGSLGIELEDVFGIKNPEGLMGQFLNEGSYTIDNEGTISTKSGQIESEAHAWHEGDKCFQIEERSVETFLGQPISNYYVENLFAEMFYKGAALLEDTVEK